MYNPRSVSRADGKKLDDLKKTQVTPHTLMGKRDKILATINLNETPGMSKNNLNSSRFPQDPCSYLTNIAKPDDSEVSSFISSEDVIAAKVFLGSKFVYEKQYSEFNKRLLSFMEKIRNRRIFRENLLGATYILNHRKISQYSAKNSLVIEAFEDSFCARFQRFIHWNIATKNLQNEINLNQHKISKNYPRIMGNLNQLNNSQNLSIAVSSNPSTNRTLISSGRKNNLNLLCIFSENNFYDDNPNLKQSWLNEDIKLVLPMNWNVVVSQNVITITDESSQNIRIFFKNPLSTKVVYEDSLSSSTNTFSKLLNPHKYISRTVTMEPGDVSENSQIRKENFSPKEQFVVSKSNKTRSEAFIQSKYFYGRTNLSKFTVKNKINPLLLADPLLLNYSDGREQKQILLYKDHSVRSMGLKGSDRNFCKTIENLLAKSVSYEGTCINLIFDPLQVIQQVRGKIKIDQKLLHDRTCYDLTLHCKSSGDHPVDPNQWNFMMEKKVFATKEALSKDTRTSFVKLMKKISNTSVIPINAQPYRDVSKEERLTASGTHSSKHSYKNIRRDPKPNLHIRLKKKSRTANKLVNANKIVASVFRHFFHFYSLLGGQLKSGSVITKSNSNYWLKVSGLINDSNSLNQADELFTATAGAKVVLNIYDYLKFLTVFARNRRLIVAELVKKMMVCELTTIFPIKKQPLSSSTMRSFPIKVATGFNRKNRLERSQSLPAIKII